MRPPSTLAGAMVGISHYRHGVSPVVVGVKQWTARTVESDWLSGPVSILDGVHPGMIFAFGTFN